MADSAQVDFYLLGKPELDARQLACRLALMAWERGHRITILTDSEDAAAELDELMWEMPHGRFLPHDREGSAAAGQTPVLITGMDGLHDADVVINLCPRPVAETGAFKRLLEIVPHRKADRDASREKFKFYRARGLQPTTHEITR